MGANRILRKYPALFLVLAAVVIANNIFRFAPVQALSGTMSFIIPSIFIAFGTIGLLMKAKEKKKTEDESL